ncbi:polyprenyl synthetase family protein [Litorimonas sp. RW-G-Af-16]
MSVIKAKTAALFAAATEVAPVLAERPAAEREALREYGLKLGLAFQLVDDALDYGGFESALGKSVGDDFREGKMTLPVIRAVAVADADETAFWRRVIVDHDQTPVDLETAVSYLRKAGALESTMDLAKVFSKDAADALDIFPKSAWRDTLQNLAGFVVARIS